MNSISRFAPTSRAVAPLMNVAMRGVTLVTRFLFLFFLAKFIDPAGVGYYGLFAASVGYALYFAGLDFYVYTTREIIKSPAEVRGRLLKGQVVLALIAYALLIPVSLIFLNAMGWPPALVWWFLPILVLEHLNQEIARLLVALSHQLTSSVILFVRQGSWAIAIVLLMAMRPETRSLEVVLACWACAGVVAALIGLAKIGSMGMRGWRLPVQWDWVLRGIRISGFFLLATLALRAIQVADRYWIEAIVGIEVVGAYVLFTGMAATVMTFLDAGLFAFSYPKLIRLHDEERTEAFRAELWRLVRWTSLISAAFAVVSWQVLPYLLTWIGKPVYHQHIMLYPLLLLAMVINAFSMIPHYGLYASRSDRPIIFSHVAGLVVFPVAVILLMGITPMYAVPIAINVAFTVILIWKAWAFLAADSKFSN